MGYKLLIPFYRNQRGKARGNPEPILICCSVYLGCPVKGGALQRVEV